MPIKMFGREEVTGTEKHCRMFSFTVFPPCQILFYQLKHEQETGEAYDMNEGEEIWCGNLKERHHLEHLGVDGNMIFK